MLPLLKQDHKIHETALYGVFGRATNITDGRFTYFKYPKGKHDQELFEYTLMPSHVRFPFEAKEFEGAELTRDFQFTRGYPLMRLPALSDARRPPNQGGRVDKTPSMLFDLKNDPGQNNSISDPDVEARFENELIRLMKINEAPPEAYRRLDLEVPG